MIEQKRVKLSPQMVSTLEVALAINGCTPKHLETLCQGATLAQVKKIMTEQVSSPDILALEKSGTLLVSTVFTSGAAIRLGLAERIADQVRNGCATYRDNTMVPKPIAFLSQLAALSPAQIRYELHLCCFSLILIQQELPRHGLRLDMEAARALHESCT